MLLVGRELFSITVQTTENCCPFFLETLIESCGSETESPRMADFQLVSGRRKETRGIKLNTVV